MKQLDQVTEFMAVMGQHMPDSPQVPPVKVVDLRQTLIAEENQELLDAANVDDIVEVADALCDLLYVVLGAFKAYGFSKELVEELFDEVQSSNMSKSCKTAEEAAATEDKYNEEGIATVTLKIGEYWTVSRASDNKVLKSINFREPDLISILRNHGVAC